MSYHTQQKRLSSAITSLRMWWLMLVCTLLLGLKPVSAYSQNFYPVHVSVQVMPPHSIYLSDYYSGSRDRLIVTLLNRDQQQRPLQVKLRILIKNGNSFQLRSREELYYPMLTLETGIPLRLTGTDLAAYLTSEKTQMNGYLREGKLPSGMTEFSVQAVDYVTGRALSEYATGRAWLETKQPPMLSLPLNDEQVAYRTPQQIRFQWMLRHQGLANTQYEFVLKELPDNGSAPQSAFTYAHEIYRTVTRFTTLNYTHLDPELLPGKRYGWQVRAIAKDGIDEIGVFENNGYSQIGWFELNDNCPAPMQVTAKGGYRKMTLDWKSIPSQRAFVVEYRPKSEQNFYEWTTARTVENNFIAYQLTPGWRYEYRVGALCLTEKPVYSAVGELVLSLDNEERLAQCGMAPHIDVNNQTGEENLKVGEVVTVGGDFPMTLTQVSSQGSGWYSGKGWLTLPWVFETKVAVKFSRLRINTDRRQIGGEVETATDPKASQIGNLNDLDYGGSQTNPAKVVFAVHRLDFSLPPVPEASYDPDKEELIIFDTNGEPHVVIPKKNEGASIFPMIVEDKDGNKYQIDLPTDEDEATSGGTSTAGDQKKPVVTPVKEIAGQLNPDHLSSGVGATIRFSKGKGLYAFDAGKEPWYERAQLLKPYYPTLGNGYVAPWKLIPVGSSDVVEAELSGKALDKKKIVFCLANGTQVAAQEVNGKWLLTLPSVGSGETYSVLALYEDKKGKYETIGKLNVVSYPPQEHTVTLVPVDGSVPDVSWTERELNRIYTPYGVRLHVRVDDCLKGNHSWDIDKDGLLDLNGSGFFSKETAEMRSLRMLYQRTAGSRYDKHAYYLFVMNNAKADSEPDNHLVVQGDMPRGKQFGYLFMNRAVNTPRLIAHELGHGIFTLLHSFDVNYSGDKFKGATPNLMDYNDGEELAVWQWNVLAHPAPLTWWDDEQDAMSVEDGVNTIADLYLKLAAQYKDGTYLALHGFKCDGTDAVKPQVSINSGDFTVLSFRTLKIRNKGRITAIIYRISDATNVESEQRQATLDELKREIRKEINGENDFLHFYKSDQERFVPLKKSIDWLGLVELRQEACQAVSGDSGEAYGKYGEHILRKLFSLKSKNSILFVNGYELTEEFLNSGKENNGYVTGNTIQPVDMLNYWNGIDLLFKQRRAVDRCYYANGHMSISTSNHRTVSNFLSSLASTKSALAAISTTLTPTVPIPPHLNTQPNVDGFKERMDNGRVAGLRFVDILKREAFAAGDTLDIVAHSMGFAYAQGIIEVIEEAIRDNTLFIHLGGYYIIAPENGCSGFVEPGRWDEIWQYGSDEQRVPITKQDGVAPQCKIENLDRIQRAFIPDTEPQGFLDSHKIANYKWIFNTLKTNDAGYVTPRK